MLDIPLTVLVLLCLVAALAGWVDAVVGGGGLVMLPALLLGFPQHPPAHALGTNKAVSVTGTTMAAVTYLRRHPVDTGLAVRCGVLAALSAALGASFATAVSKEVLQPLIMVILLAVAGFVVFRPEFGTTADGRTPTRRRVAVALLVAGVVIGFYDGLIGPGTGTFLIIAFVGILHMTMLSASATAKVVNMSTNIGALVAFAVHGTVLWTLALLLAVFNMTGAYCGARMAMRRGSGFVRLVLLVVVVVLVGRLGYDQWWA